MNDLSLNDMAFVLGSDMDTNASIVTYKICQTINLVIILNVKLILRDLSDGTNNFTPVEKEVSISQLE
jgi:hypothetical protein